MILPAFPRLAFRKGLFAGVLCSLLRIGDMAAHSQRTEWMLQAAVILAGLRGAMVGRNLPIGSDGLAYLDVARAYLRHDWTTALNGYWGPLYSWLLAGMELVFRPAPEHEFLAVRAVNGMILVFCVFAFGSFWKSVAKWSRRSGSEGIALFEGSPVAWLYLGYILLATRILWLVEEVSPDLLVGGIVLLACSEVFQLNEGRHDAILRYARLGLLLAIGYYAKAILIYFGIFVLAALISRGVRTGSSGGPIAALVVSLALVSPHTVALSRALGHFSLGESGRLNYAWFVDGTETGSWAQGGASFPFFPGAIFLNYPRVFQVPHIDGVTYAPWYDAARFDKRSQPSFSFRKQARQVAVNLKSLKEDILGTESALLVCLIILIGFAPQAFYRNLAQAWFCAVPVCLVIGMYLLVHLADRFMVGFLLVLWGILFASIRAPLNLQTLSRRALLAGTIVFAMATFPGLLRLAFSAAPNPMKNDLRISESLRALGIQKNDAVGLIGDGQTAYWAYWARLSIASEVPAMDAAQFWSGSAEQQRAAVWAMENAGAKAVIWRRDSGRACLENWKSLPDDSGCIIVLHPIAAQKE